MASDASLPPATEISAPPSLSRRRLEVVSRATEPIEGSASPAKAERMDIVERIGDLRGAVPAHGKLQIALVHARAVVGHPKQALAAARGSDLDTRGACVERVLDRFLGSAGGAFDDLAGGNLVDERFGKQQSTLPPFSPDSRGEGRRKRRDKALPAQIFGCLMLSTPCKTKLAFCRQYPPQNAIHSDRCRTRSECGRDQADTTRGRRRLKPRLASKTALFGAVCESLSSAFIVYDKTDHIVFCGGRFSISSRSAPISCSPARDCGIFERRLRNQDPQPFGRQAGRAQPRGLVVAEDCLALARTLRGDSEGATATIAGVGFQKRRLPGSYGVCVISDISEAKKREEQWRLDLERVQLTEDILDNLPFPLFVKDRNLTYVYRVAFCEKYRTTADEVLGRKSAELFLARGGRPLRGKRPPRSRNRRCRWSASARSPATARNAKSSRASTASAKPGRYFLISTMQDLPREGGDLEEIREGVERHDIPAQSSFRRACVPMIGDSERREPAAMEAIVPEFLRSPHPCRHRRYRRRDAGAEDAGQVRLRGMLGAQRGRRGAVSGDRHVGRPVARSRHHRQSDGHALPRARRAVRHPVAGHGRFQISTELTFQIARHFNRNNRGSMAERIDGDWGDHDIRR